MARQHAPSSRGAGSGSSGAWQAGFAEADITPPIGRPMLGYGRERYATGVIAPLRAQALALRDGKGRCGVIFTADVLGFDVWARDLLRWQLAERHGVDPAGVLICPSHTHWGPGTIYRVDFYAGLPDVYTLRRTLQTLVDLADRAIESLSPAVVDYAELDTRIGSNRRPIGEDGKASWGVNPQGHYDTHTPVLRIEREPAHSAPNGGDDTRTVMLVGHACHPTSTGATPRWSPDYPGAMRDMIEQRLGPGARAMFVMGCGADAKVVHEDRAAGQLVFSASPRHAKQAGRKLAKAVLDHVKADPWTRLDASLDLRQATAPLPLARRPKSAEIQALAFDEHNAAPDVNWARQSLAFPDARTACDYEAVAWVLGDQLTLFGLPDEVCSPIGPRTRAQARTPLAMTIGYANSVQCYIPTNAIVREGGYEGDTSHRSYFMPAPFAPRIDKAFTALIEKLVGP